MSGKRIKIICVVGARPNFMKIAPIIQQMRTKTSNIEAYLLHTGQHYDADMKQQFFTQLGIPEPDVDLEVGSASHAVQTAEVMIRFEPVLDDIKPDAVLVVGDVNSTIACALVAKKKGIKVIHVESGLRSYDNEMPEEINRVLTDQISDYLFITEKSAADNLQKEGIDVSKVFFVGNVMIDTLLANLKKATEVSKIFTRHELDGKFSSGSFALITLHRPSNVDDKETLCRLLNTIADISTKVPVIFPLHPRTKSKIEEFGYLHLLEKPSIAIFPPLGYLDLLGLMSKAQVVLTDSGGIQEETTALGIPCLTLRENTERPITVAEGTNIVVGTDSDKIKAELALILEAEGKSGRVPEYWDGKAAERICRVLEERLS